MKKSIIYILKFGISFSLLLIFINKVNLSQFIETVKSINLSIFLFIIFISISQIAIISAVQKLFLANISLGLNYQDMYKENLIAAFFGFIAPGMVGTDSYYIYSYGKKISDYSKAISGILFLRIMGFLMLIILVILSFIYIGKNFTTENNFIINIDFVQFLIGLFVASVIISLILLCFREKILKHYRKLKEDFIGILIIAFKKKKMLLSVIILLLSFYSFSMGSRLVLASIISIDISVIKLGAIILIVNFILMIPVSISGIGVREGGFIGLLSLYGVSPEKAFLLSFFDFSITFFAALLGGIILLNKIIIRRRNADKKV